MEPNLFRAALTLAVSGMAAILLWRYRQEILDAIRRGPWGGGDPPATGPAPAADPFRRGLLRKNDLPAV
ncbi:MAG: hypothetical protein JNL98_18140 [Bryobacterales bacterium]|nr:hypothetical protein [Bryobacterales bacterium]